MNKVRKSNFELLRIIAMVMIIAHHVAVHGQCVFDIKTIAVNDLWLQFLKLWGKVGVNIFVLISGYFLVRSKKINIVKTVKLWMKIAFYSVGIYIALVVCTSIKFGKMNFLKSIMPIVFDQWWFASTYMVLYLLHPLLNRIICNIDKKRYEKLLIIMTLCWCIIPTFTSKLLQANELVWFVYLYFLAGYIRIWADHIRWKAKKCIFGALFIALFTYLVTVGFYFAGLKYIYFRYYATSFYTMFHLPIVLISVLLFLGFKNLEINDSKYINAIASATFGVYLIHDNVHLRPVIWVKVFRLYKHFWKKWFILYTIGAILVVFIVCTVIELIRTKVCAYVCKRINLELKNKIYVLFVSFIYAVKNRCVNSFVRFIGSFYMNEKKELE